MVALAGHRCVRESDLRPWRHHQVWQHYVGLLWRLFKLLFAHPNRIYLDKLLHLNRLVQYGEPLALLANFQFFLVFIYWPGTKVKFQLRAIAAYNFFVTLPEMLIFV